MPKTFIFDLDGTIYLGKTPIPGAIETIYTLRSHGHCVLFLTNAATRSRSGMVEKLSEMGLEVQEKEIYCGSYILAQYIKKNYPKKSVYVVGEIGLIEEFEKHGIECTEDGAQVVVAGLDREFSYEKLQMAHKQIRNGAAFIASNKDHIYPTETGPKPGCGAIVSSIEYSSEKKAYTLGKPSRYAFDIMLEEYSMDKKETYMVGDRLDTDIMFAKNCGIKSILVLTGNAKKEDIKEIRPDFVFESVRNIAREEKLQS